MAHVFKRAVVRARILTGDVSLHTLRHTALSRMIAAGIDDHTVMALLGPQLDADAGAVHASDRPGRWMRSATFNLSRDGHNPVTIAGGTLRRVG